MHCLLCHKKISRIRHWRTKSEFCCDEHAATHRQQTLDRLFDPQAAGPADESELAALSSLQDAPGGKSEAMAVAEDNGAPSATSAGAYDDAVGEAATGHNEAEDRSAPERGEEPQSTRPRLSLAGVQHDEPFPVEVQPTDGTRSEEAFGHGTAAEGVGGPSADEIEDSQEAATLDSEEPNFRIDEPAAQDDTASRYRDGSAEESEVPLPEAESVETEPDAEEPLEAIAAGSTEDERGALDEEPEQADVVPVEEEAVHAGGDFDDAPAAQIDEPAVAETPLVAANEQKEVDDEAVSDLSQLADGVRSLTPQAIDIDLEPTSRSGKRSAMICFLPVQGGNGASTVSLHVADAISRNSNDRVLLTDFDFHSGTLAFRLGLKPSHTLVDVFDWKQDPEALWDNATCRWKGLDVLVAPPSNRSLPAASLERMPEVFASAMRRYRYVIVDHPDAIYSSSRHIFNLSHLVYLVCTPEITSLHLARRKVQQIRAMGVPGDRLRLIVNRAGSWGSLGIEDVGRIVGAPVSWALDNDYAALRDATWNGGLVKEGSALARQLQELGSSVMRSDNLADVKSEAWDDVGVSVG